MNAQSRFALGTAVALTVGVLACGGDSVAAVARAKLAEGCLLDSDCSEPLVCAFKTCHDRCKESRDCPAGQRCVASDRPYHVCQLPGEAACSSNSQCPASQVCGVDNQCRDFCRTDRDCLTGQRCTTGTCAEDSELNDGGLPGDAGEQAGTPCSYSSDCPEPLVCRTGYCAPECKTTRDCPRGATCTGGRCLTSDAGSCVLSSDCPGALVCVQGLCVEECQGDKDCRSLCVTPTGCEELVCDLAIKRCRARGDAGGD